MAAEVGVGLSITLPHGEPIAVGGGSHSEQPAPSYDVFWPGLAARTGIDWPGTAAPIDWPGV